MIRPYEYSASPTQATGIYPSPYAKAEYDEAGNPILDTRERNYFDQRFAELQPYSAKPGTVNPNTVPVTMAANGGLMFDNPSGMDEDRNLMRGNLQKGLFGLGYAEGGNVKHMFGGGLTAMIAKMVKDNPDVLTQYEYDKINQRYNTVNQPQQSTNDFIQMFGGPMGARESVGLPAYQFDPEARQYRALAGGGSVYAEGGEIEMDEKRRKAIMKNIKGSSTKELEQMMGAMNQQEFLMKNMPNYAQAMSPSISGMVEGAQYGDRMTRAYEDIAKKRAMEMGEKFVPQENYARIQPTMVNPQSGTYGGIASIGRQIDPNTRVNAMANIQRTPYDRNAMESVRRLGVGVDRQLGKDTNLSAFYEQDPKGREKMGGVRLSQRFNNGGNIQGYSLGGYSDGGRLLRGPGDGVSDDIPATIGNRQPARLADGEFVIPARIVSELGNGSTDAGAKRLYAMMDKIQAGRKKTVGKGKVAVDSKAKKHLLA
jgi:hypothetical protein